MISEITPNLEETLFVKNGSAAQHKNEIQFLPQKKRACEYKLSGIRMSLPKRKVCDGVGGTVKKLTAAYKGLM